MQVSRLRKAPWLLQLFDNFLWLPAAALHRLSELISLRKEAVCAEQSPRLIAELLETSRPEDNRVLFGALVLWVQGMTPASVHVSLVD